MFFSTAPRKPLESPSLLYIEHIRRLSRGAEEPDCENDSLYPSSYKHINKTHGDISQEAHAYSSEF